jgi:hypothetical protein
MEGQFQTEKRDSSIFHYMDFVSGFSCFLFSGCGFFIAAAEWSRREADHSPPSSVDIKNVWSYISTSPIRIHVAVLA